MRGWHFQVYGTVVKTNWKDIGPPHGRPDPRGVYWELEGKNGSNLGFWFKGELLLEAMNVTSTASRVAVIGKCKKIENGVVVFEGMKIISASLPKSHGLNSSSNDGNFFQRLHTTVSKHFK